MKIIKYITFLLILFLLSLPACILDEGQGGGGDYDLWEYEIKQVIYSVYQGYNNEDIFQIMDNFSDNFLHNNLNYTDEEALWYDRFDQDSTATVSSHINVIFFNNEYAKASYVLKMDNNYHEVYSLSDNYSDVTIFARDEAVWKVYGNQNYDSYYDLSVDSYPESARIYIDGNFVEETTPATLEHISPGQYDIGVYLKGYNEITETIYLDEDIYRDYDLQYPSEPIPDITIISPENGETFNSKEFLLSGYINNFEGNEAILTYNGMEYILEVDEVHDFRVYVTLTQSENTFFIRATNINGNTGISEDYTVYWNQ